MKKFIILLLLLLIIPSCSNNKTYEKHKTFLGTIQDKDGSMVLLLNTEVYLTCVDEDKEEDMIKTAKELIKTYHIMLDSHHEYEIANLYTLNNDRYLKDDSNILIDALEFSINMAKLTKGYFNPTVGSLFNLYDGKFANFDYINEDPNEQLIKEAQSSIIPYDQLENYIVIDKDNNSITLLPYNNQEYLLDLGAISKGYIVDTVFNKLIEYNSSFLLSAGSSSVASYVNPDEGINWNVGYRNPDDSSSSLFAYNMNNKAVSSSGDSQQYYLKEDGTRRCHILNPYTGYSENYYRSIILMSSNNSSGILDALSTALFNINDQEIINDIINSVEKEYSISIDYAFHYPNNDVLMSNDFSSLLIESYTSDKINITEGE